MIDRTHLQNDIFSFCSNPVPFCQLLLLLLLLLLFINFLRDLFTALPSSSNQYITPIFVRQNNVVMDMEKKTLQGIKHTRTRTHTHSHVLTRTYTHTRTEM
jgi:hypothetical protein